MKFLKFLLKLSIAILIITICWRIGLGQTVSIQSPIKPFQDNGKSMIFKGRVAGDWKSWLTVESHNGQYWSRDGYDPCYTSVVCDYKPIFRRLPTGQFEILFVSPIAEKLP